MVLNFPTSPINGQVSNDFYFDSSVGTEGAWRSSPVPIGGLPAGSIIQWAGSTAPANWFIADGSAVSRTANASLFAVIGTTYGAGDGSTTFNLPDLRGRVPVGKNGGTFGTLGATGGAEAVTLASNNLPQAAVIDANTAGNDTSFALKFSQVAAYSAKTLAQLGTATTAVNNLQPYLVTNYIIKATAGWSAGDSELAQRVGVLEAAPAGLVRVVPTSVAVGSGSATVSASGVVTFTGITSASYLSLNGVFTSTYSDYKIIIAPTLTAGTSDLFARFRYNGTDYSGGVYGAGAGAVYSSPTLATYGLLNNATNMALGPIGVMQSNHEVTASPRAGNSSIKWHSYASHSAQSTSAGYNQAVTSRPDGFTIVPGASSIAGTIQIYGYRN